MNGGKFLHENEHLLMRERRETYHGREQVAVFPRKASLCKP